MPEYINNKIVNQHKILKIYFITSLVILVPNTALLSLALIPFAGLFIIEGLSPFLVVTGLIGLVNLILIPISLSKKYYPDTFKTTQIKLLLLSLIAVWGGYIAAGIQYALSV